MHKTSPGLPEDELPTPKFIPKILEIRKKKGQEPIHKNVLWNSKVGVGDVDILFLMQYLESQGLDCHVNNGVHGKTTNGKFELFWKGDGADLFKQD